MIPAAALLLTLQGFAAPEPGMLEEMRRRHRWGHVLRVTSGAERFECRAQELDALGLHGITPYGRAATPSDPFPWTQVERLDRLTTRTTSGIVTGAILGGLGVLFMPDIANSSPDKKYPYHDYFLLGSLVGGVAGGYLGHRVSLEHRLYVAQVVPADRMAGRTPPPPVPADSVPPPAAADSIASGAAVPSPVAADKPTPVRIATPTASFAADSRPEVRRALHHIDSNRLLRIDGAFGRFHGYTSQANTGGLLGLRAEPTLESVGGVRVLRWSEIDRIDVRGGSAGEGALRGALIVGGVTAALGAVLGAALDSYGGGSSPGSAMIQVGAIGFGVGGVVGALFGSAIGTGVKSWHTIYARH